MGRHIRDENRGIALACLYGKNREPREALPDATLKSM